MTQFWLDEVESNCKHCMFCDACINEYCTECDDYCMIDDEDENMAVERFIESERESFREQWFKYLEENNDY